MNENDRASEEVDIDPFTDAPDPTLRVNDAQSFQDDDEVTVIEFDGEILGGDAMAPEPKEDLG